MNIPPANSKYSFKRPIFDKKYKKKIRYLENPIIDKIINSK